MATLLRFSEAAALALHGMAYLAVRKNEVVNARQMARMCHASEAHMAKVCQRLARHGLLTARRGIHGGFALGRSPGRIRLLDIYTAIEGPVVLNPCLFRNRTCADMTKHECVFGMRIQKFEGELLRYLRKTSLASVAHDCDLGDAA